MLEQQDYPFVGNPRTFRAVAMPNGDARWGIEGHLVLLVEQRRHCMDKPKVLSRAEAEQLHAELGAALAAFGLAKDMARSVAADIGARACTDPYPFRNHRSLAEVGADQREAV